jgi:hypothetical protein
MIGAGLQASADGCSRSIIVEKRRCINHYPAGLLLRSSNARAAS